MTAHAKLIAEIEAATEGSEKLDRAIAIAANIPWSSDEGGQFGGYGLLPHRVWFSRSLDAAMTLVPEGWVMANLWLAVNVKDWPWYEATLRRYIDEDVKQQLNCLGAATPALALASAAMKAREAS